MIEDKVRWNQKYKSCAMPGYVAPVVKNYLKYANVGRALDIACGTGRHTNYLAEHGYSVDAVDISDYALSQIPFSDKIRTIEADLDGYEIPKESYDLIINCNFLERNHFPMMIEALKPAGLLIFETFLEAEGEGFHQPSNPDFLLKHNELLHAFESLEIIHYEEHESVNHCNERVNIASLVARKGVLNA
ncbi:MAG: methyltransferase domain-containing protein [Campylobacterota bacterium]|nr:methyltransferase domain-containing protein [Campylobacterota bacterium]